MLAGIPLFHRLNELPVIRSRGDSRYRLLYSTYVLPLRASDPPKKALDLEDFCHRKATTWLSTTHGDLFGQGRDV